MPQTKLTGDTLGQFVSGAPVVLVKLGAPWCGPCRQLDPILDQMAGERPDVAFGNVDIDESPQVAADNGVMSVPVLLLYRDGELVAQQQMSGPKRRIEQFIAQAA